MRRKKVSKKVIGFLMMLVMIATMAPAAVFADDVKHPISEIEQKIKETGDYMLDMYITECEEFGLEWKMMGLARAGRAGETNIDAYYESVVETLKEVDSNILDQGRPTENERTIIALTALGKNAEDVEGYNLIEPLADFDFVKSQGLNSVIFALIAIDTHNYQLPEVEGVNQNSREKMIDFLLNERNKDGGWWLFGASDYDSDPDITAMSIQALAPYYSRADVKAAVDGALECLSKMQEDDGGFKSMGTANSESCAQVITALSSLGFDAQRDSRFIKNGNSVMDAFLGYYVEDGGFEHVPGWDENPMATEQGYYTLVAYDRFLKGKTSLYDMSDVKLEGEVIPEEPDDQKPLPQEPELKPEDSRPEGGAGSTPDSEANSKPSKPELDKNSSTPLTGDYENLMVYIVFAILAGIVMHVMISLKKKGEQ